MVDARLSCEENELLELLEGPGIPDGERVRELFESLVARHWRDLLVYVRRRCFVDTIQAEDIVVDTFVRAYDMILQQMDQAQSALGQALPMRYQRTQCPQFLGFVKALARWRYLDAARKMSRYRLALDRCSRHEARQARQYGQRRLRHQDRRVPLRPVEPLQEPRLALWACVNTLPSREQLVVWLYFQHGPEPIDLPGFTALATRVGLGGQEVRRLQRRFRALGRWQQTRTVCRLTQEDLAVLLDVDRETIRRTLVQARRRLRCALDGADGERVEKRV